MGADHNVVAKDAAGVGDGGADIEPGVAGVDDAAGLVVELVGIDDDAFSGFQRAAVGQCAAAGRCLTSVVLFIRRGRYRQLPPGRNDTSIVHTGAAVEAGILLTLNRGCFTDGEAAGLIQCDVAFRAGQGAGDVHAHPFFGTDQADLAGVHAAQCTDVQADGGLRAGTLAVAVDNLDVLQIAVAETDLIAAGQDVGFVGPECGVDFCAAG